MFASVVNYSFILTCKERKPFAQREWAWKAFVNDTAMEIKLVPQP